MAQFCAISLIVEHARITPIKMFSTTSKPRVKLKTRGPHPAQPKIISGLKGYFIYLFFFLTVWRYEAPITHKLLIP